MCKILKSTSYSKNISFGKIKLKDIDKIRRWRNSQIDVLRQNSKITKLKQWKYFLFKVWIEQLKDEPTQLLFRIAENGELIGYCGLVHINWKEKIAEVSFLLNQDFLKNMKKYEYVFTEAIVELLKLAKLEKIEKLITETYSFRGQHIKILEKNGFSLVTEIKSLNLDLNSSKMSVFHEIIV